MLFKKLNPAVFLWLLEGRELPEELVRWCWVGK